jgi:hypothetical protein
LPIGLYVKPKRCFIEAEGVVHPLTALSHINVRVERPPKAVRSRTRG